MKYLIPLFTTTALFLVPNIVQAQTYKPSNRSPVEDASIGTKVNNTGDNNFNITGGLNRGQNLFHSFIDFSIPTGGSANFINPAENKSIITRVTGDSFSDINGLLNTNGANFLLINPNGVVFGTNAKLNVGKAFVTSTASGIDFVDAQGKNYNFGVNRAGDALLKIDPNVAFNPARLIMGGGSSKGIENYGTLETTNQGQYIGLIGGNITFNGGQIKAPGGRVDLGGLSVPGAVGLGVEGNLPRAQFPTDLARGDVSFTNGARVSVAGAGGGDIAITARNLEILSQSVIRGGIETSLGTPEAVAGDIKIDATGELVIAGSDTGIGNNVHLNSKGNGGNIAINTGSFTLRDGAALQAITYGQGNAGNVTVKADAVSLVNGNIFSTINAGGVGKGGNITIDAGSLSLQDSAQLLTITRGASDTQPAGKGDAGNVNVKVSGAVDIAGTKDGLPSAIFSYVDTGTEGNAGNITIDAGSFSLRDGARLTASTFGTGNGGNVTVTADAVSLVNVAILSTIEAGGVGKGGNITIDAGSLSLQDSAQLSTSTRGASDTQPAGKGNAGNVNVKVRGAVDIAGTKDGFSSGILSDVETGAEGNAGNITIDAGSFSLRDSATLQSSTAGIGNAGNVTVTAKNNAVSLANRASIFSTVEAGGVGKGGNITIDAGSLSLQNGAQLITITRKASDTQPAGKGDAGNVNVKVSGAVDIAGIKDGFSSGIRSSVNTGTVGNGGNITIDAGSFSLRDGAQLTASTYGTGNAGNVTVTAKDAVSFAGNSYIFSTVEAGGVGKGGNITIEAGALSIQDGAQLITSTRKASDTQPAGKGDAGNVIVNVSGAVHITGRKDGLPSAIFSDVQTGTEGNAGNITIDAGSFSLRDGAVIGSATGGIGNAGNIGIKAKGDITLAGTGTFVNNQPTNIIKSLIYSSSAGVGDAGKISIDNPSGKLSLSFSNIQTTIGDREIKNATGIGQGISINARELEIKNNSVILSDLFGKGRAGDIDIKTTGDITISGNNKIFDANEITTFNISVISSTTRGIGDGGKISIETPGKLSLDSTGYIISSLDKDAQGTSKGIKINVGELNLTNVGIISSDTLGKNPAGDIEIITKGGVNINNGVISTSSFKGTFAIKVPGSSDLFSSGTGEGKAGNISISSDRLNLDSGIIFAIGNSDSGGNITLNLSDKLLLRNGSQITTSSGVDIGDESAGESGGGSGGNITINSPLIVALPAINGGGNDITANAFTGNGGKVNITSQGLFGIQYRAKGSRLTNDITASSRFGLSGSVQITTPGIDPAKDTGELPAAPNDASNQISQACGASQRDNKFYITGRGGLPPNASEPQESEALWEDARAVKATPATTANQPEKFVPPAIGWVFEKNGRVRLIAAQTAGEAMGTRVVCAGKE